MEGIAPAIGALVAPVLAAWLHELTHAAAAVALGGRVHRVDLIALFVDFEFDPRAPVRERLVLLAPAIVGIAIGAIALLAWDGTLSLWTAVAVLGWVVYSLNGGVHGEIQLPAIGRSS